MKKTISVHLGGRAFQIDEDAYQILEDYMKSLRAKYGIVEGGEEIIADIEARMAEMFAERMNEREVITLDDVEQVVTTMGRPEDFDVDEEEEEAAASGERTRSRRKNRRLFRDPDDKVFAGVISGITQYLGIKDPIWFRLAFVLFLFMSFGTALLLYIILMLIIPEAKTASDKLQMRGEEINIDNIEKTIKDNIDNLKSKLHGEERPWRRGRGHSRAAEAVGGVFGLLFMLVRGLLKLVGLALIVFGLGVIMALLISLIVPVGLFGFDVFNLLPLAFHGTTNLIISLTGIALLLLVPLIAITFLGFRVLLQRPLGFKGMGASMGGLWTLGLILTIVGAISLSRDNHYTRNNQEQVVLQEPANGVMNLTVLKDEFYDEEYYRFFDYGKLRLENDTIYVRDKISLDVRRSKNDQYLLEKTYRSNGRDRDEANELSSLIDLPVVQDSAGLQFPVYFKVPEQQGIHGQEVELVLYVPEGGAVYLSKESRELIYDIKNVTNTYDGKMVGHTWKMLPAGLTCLDCGFENTTPAPVDKGSTFKGGKTIDLDPFHEVELEGVFDYKIERSDEYKVVVEELDGNGNGFEIKNVNGTLSIGLNKRLRDWFKDHDKGTVWIYTPELTSLQISGACEGELVGFDGETLDLDLDGASSCDLKNVDLDRLNVELDGASDVSANGRADYLDIDLSGASSFSGFDLVTDDAEVDLSAASDAEVHVTGTLNADVSGVSNLTYDGGATVSSETSGASSIKPRQ